jgi:DNA primase
MGTALTERQVGLIRSVASTFVQALDPDAAGQEATLRSLESSWRVFERQRVGESRRSVGTLYQTRALNLKIATLPTGLDPDKLIREDPSEWERLIREAVPFLDFVIPALASKYDMGTEQGKAQAAEALLPLVTATGNAFEQERLFRKLAQVLDVSEAALEASIGRPRPGGYPRSRSEVSSRRDRERAATISPLLGDRKESLEEFILALVLIRPELKELVTDLPPEQLHGTANREVFTCWRDCSTMDELRHKLDHSLTEHLDYLAHMDLAPTDRPSAEAALTQSMQRLEQRHLQEIQESLLASDDESLPPSKELEEEIIGVNARLRELFSK